jgi:hypothetical protein
MKIEVNIEKKYFFLLASILVLGFLVIYVNAYGTATPATFGHNAGEIEEADPTVIASVKDGISWGEITGRPPGLDDGDDVGGSIPSDIRVNSICDENGQNCKDISEDGWGYSIAYVFDYTEGIKDNSNVEVSCPIGYTVIACSINNAEGTAYSISFSSTSGRSCIFHTPNCPGSMCDGAWVQLLCRLDTNSTIDHQDHYISR